MSKVSLSITGRQINSSVFQVSDELAALNSKVAAYQRAIDDANGTVFGDFCERLGIANIAEYEDKQLKQAQEEGEANLKFTKQINRLDHQYA